MSDELRPCPHCGKKVGVALCGGDPDYYWLIHGGMHHYECKCRVFMESCKFEMEDENEPDERALEIRGGLIRRWNRRVDA